MKRKVKVSVGARSHRDFNIAMMIYAHTNQYCISKKDLLRLSDNFLMWSNYFRDRAYKKDDAKAFAKLNVVKKHDWIERLFDETH